MFITKKHLPRRTFLRGMGVAVALPLLDAMVPALTPLARAQARPRTRFGAIYVPNGAIMEQWIPEVVGAGFDFKPILKPLEPFKDQVVVVTNLTRSHPGSQVGDHAVSAAGFLTGVWPKRTEAEDVFANTTIDQVVARADRPGHAVPVARSRDRGLHRLRRRLLARLQLRLPEHGLVEHAVDAAADGHQPARGVRAHVRPGAAVRRSARRASATSAACSTRSPPRRGSCSGSSGTRDRQRVSASIWRTCARSSGASSAPRRAAATDVTLDAPVGVPDSFEEHVGADVRPDGRGVSGRRHARVHVHAVARAEPADLPQHRRHRAAPLRVASRQRPAEDRAEREGQHLSHGRCSRSSSRSCEATPDGDGSVLDHSLIFYGGGMGNPNGHASDPLPVRGASAAASARATVTSSSSRGRRSATCGWRSPISTAARMETFGDSNGRVEDFFA